MFAIGLLSLFSVGLAVMFTGGEDDVSEADETEQDEALLAETQNGTPIEVPGLTYDPDESADPEQVAEIKAFLKGLEANPTDDMPQRFEDFLAGLAAEAEEESTDETVGAEDESTDDTVEAEDEMPQEVARPPMGEQYRDPLVIAEELEAQRILDEIAAEEARQPVNLVTVSNASGSEIDDDLVLTERADDASPDDPAFTVTAPDGPNEISVGYDAEHTFKIEYNAQTSSVTAGLNSEIEGPAGLISNDTQTSEADDGTLVVERMLNKTFEGKTDISISVDGDHIGTHVAKIDLINPKDTVNFEFANANGSFHILFFEADDTEGSDNISTKRAFIVQTADTQAELSAKEVDEIANQGLARTATTNVIAEIFLGYDTVALNEGAAERDGAETWIMNFINDNPQISANIEWASVSSHDDTPVQGGSAAGAGGSGSGTGTVGAGGMTPAGTVDDEDALDELFKKAGLNPAFFGF